MSFAYDVLGERASLASANKRFLKVFQDRADRNEEQTIGTPGGSDVLMTWYSKSLNLWVAATALGNRYWNAFGYGDPFVADKVAPTVEINPPVVAGSSNTAALFLTNANGNVEVAHTGRVGGGRSGIGKLAFHAYHPLHERVLVGGRRRDLYILGSLDEPDELARNVADFVRVVRNFKSGVGATTVPPPVDPEFRPEFEGTTTYEVTLNRTATYTHGRVINSLHDQLGAMGVVTRRTSQIDLFSSPTPTRQGVVFEAKTCCDTQSLYTCVGQLMYLPPSPAWKRVAVLPTPVNPKVNTRLGELGITVLEYVILDSGPVQFLRLQALVADLEDNDK